jgi:hypothetical protein
VIEAVTGIRSTERKLERMKNWCWRMSEGCEDPDRWIYKLWSRSITLVAIEDCQTLRLGPEVQELQNFTLPWTVKDSGTNLWIMTSLMPPWRVGKCLGSEREVCNSMILNQPPS